MAGKLCVCTMLAHDPKFSGHVCLHLCQFLVVTKLDFFCSRRDVTEIFPVLQVSYRDLTIQHMLYFDSTGYEERFYRRCKF